MVVLNLFGLLAELQELRNTSEAYEALIEG